MSEQDYTLILETQQSPEVVFKAINDVQAWWAEDFKGALQRINDEFEVRFFETVHYSKHKVVEMIPNQKVVWLVTDSSLSFLENKGEWTGTTNSFEITENDGKTQIRFTHHGLVPAIECYGDCTHGWNQFLKHSLLPLINTGKGCPKILEKEVNEKATNQQ
jgi:hypothetical protein